MSTYVFCTTLARQTSDWCDKGWVTIDVPDDVPLEIFIHYMNEAENGIEIEAWQTLIHVCQNWRYLVFG
jgi:hypothetical protein